MAYKRTIPLSRHETTESDVSRPRPPITVKTIAPAIGGGLAGIILAIAIIVLAIWLQHTIKKHRGALGLIGNPVMEIGR